MDDDNTSLSEPGYCLVLEFPDQSPSFAHGVEFGKIWASLNLNVDICVSDTTASENREALRRLAEYLGWKVEIKTSDVEGWDFSTFTKIKTAPTRANPRAFHVVK